MAQRGHLFPWVPVCLGCGVGLYFTIRSEPSVGHLLGGAAAALGLAAMVPRTNATVTPILWALALCAAGFSLAGFRAHKMAEPVLGWRYYGPVEGRIVNIDRSASDALRLTLDRVVLRDVPPESRPERVRIALHGPQGFITPEPGLRVIMTAHVSPPGGPVEPGGFDFQRHAWFLKLGGVGYTRTPVLAIAPPDGTQVLFKARMALSAHVQSILSGEVGAFAAAIMTGDRAGMGQDTLETLRISNLAHLLAISGLHMGLLAGFVFAAVRLGFAAVPFVGLRVPAKKISAFVALVAAAGYLALSGGNVATERAFVMVAVALMAVMFDRRVFSLRAVAVAAVIVLCLRPEALLGPGFQMSFAATTALVAVFGWLRDHEVPLGPGWMRPVSAVVISSFVAGAATAPVAAAHFNQFAHFGLIANLLSVPLMGVLVMPAAVLAACLLPFGLDAAALWLMGLGLRWILGVAHWVSGLEGARGAVFSPEPLVLPVLALGMLVVILWQGRLRIAGMIPATLAIVLWTQSERPDVLISEDGSLVGVMTDQGRALSKERGTGFVAMNWLENDGDAALQKAAAARWPKRAPGAIPVTALRGKREAAALLVCDKGEWVVLNVDPPKTADKNLPCTVLHPKKLRQSGAVALFDTQKGVKVVTARQITGARLWNSQ
ncbi:ComEC family competence protein [Roseovarius litorisediminis]|uniref:ComEC family competence protein n=1 Tax=Roseovarius litorisediminis TaxID=1312363 RepID=A0A1Y5RDH8_9RHOB|nr:ComEC/Rec2 family competence protein [Roseovarius litorisediminis]SLN14900.1 ComEC family competence protein [Roseovarius litorisediminis]